MEILSLAAGLLAGEGMIALLKRNTQGYDLRVSFSNTEPAMVYWFKNNFGGNVYIKERNNPKHRTGYEWHLNGLAAVIFLKNIVPYLDLVGSAKAEQARVAIEYVETMPRPTSRVGLPKFIPVEQVLQRDTYYYKIQDLKHTIYSVPLRA